jgi:hypothetical protein
VDDCCAMLDVCHPQANSQQNRGAGYGLLCQRGTMMSYNTFPS